VEVRHKTCFLTIKIILNLEIFALKIFLKKAIPAKAWTDHEGSRRLRLPDFKTLIT
jgi:hypothetical protein